jgi:hypothetical protein
MFAMENEGTRVESRFDRSPDTTYPVSPANVEVGRTMKTTYTKPSSNHSKNSKVTSNF